MRISYFSRSVLTIGQVEVVRWTNVFPLDTHPLISLGTTLRRRFRWDVTVMWTLPGLTRSSAPSWLARWRGWVFEVDRSGSVTDDVMFLQVTVLGLSVSYDGVAWGTKS